MAGHVATAEIDVDASMAEVWRALTDPELIRRYRGGTHVETDWQEGSPVSWRGEHDGQPYEDKGTVLEVTPGQRLVVSHFSPLGGKDDVPENYRSITYMLNGVDGRTHLTLSQDGNASPAEADHAREEWQGVLETLRDVVEEG